jgi:hypothetical protein
MALDPICLQLMTSLSVRLNITECCVKGISGYDFRLECHSSCRRRGWERPLEATVHTDGASATQEWKQLCNYLAIHILPDRLKISVICATDNDATAKIVTAPMLRLPVLKECAIRLGNKHNKDFSFLAKETAMNATQKSIRHCPSIFRFIDLPTEIQIRILEFTDIVTPYDIGWYLPPGSSLDRVGASPGLYFELRRLQYSKRIRNMYV